MCKYVTLVSELNPKMINGYNVFQQLCKEEFKKRYPDEQVGYIVFKKDIQTNRGFIVFKIDIQTIRLDILCSRKIFRRTERIYCVQERYPDEQVG